MRLILVSAFLLACRLPAPPPPKPIVTCSDRPRIAYSCPGVALYGAGVGCLRCWKTDSYVDDVKQMILGCYSETLGAYCTDIDGCDDQLCAPVPVITPPQGTKGEEEAMLCRR